MKITHWQLHGNLPWLSIWGTTWGHARFKDGGPLTTSSIKILDLADQKITTLNSVYELEDTEHKECLLTECGGKLCCTLNPVIRCLKCSLPGCKVCFADLDTLLVKSCSSNNKFHTWNMIGVK